MPSPEAEAELLWPVGRCFNPPASAGEEGEGESEFKALDAPEGRKA